MIYLSLGRDDKGNKASHGQSVGRYAYPARPLKKVDCPGEAFFLRRTMHYYQFNIGDYASHTRGLSLLEDLAYRRLLDQYYLNERPFNKCSTTVARLIGMKDYVSEVDYVLRTFFVENEEKEWINVRADREIQHFKTKSEKAAVAGKASAMRRLNERSTDVKQTLNGRQLTNNHKPITNNQEPLLNPPTPQGVDNGFEEFWQAYPKKVGKTAAQKAWSKLKSHKNSLELIKAALEWQRVSDQWTKENGQFIPNPATYLNQGRWLDTPIEPAGIPKLTKYGLRAQAAAERWLARHKDEGVANEN